jgi:single-strand DNA-binding protein
VFDMNRLTLIGYLGADPWRSKSDRQACGFAVATNHHWTSPDGTKHEETSWVDVVVFGALCQHCLAALRRGSRVAVSGRLRVEREQKDGVWSMRAQCIADEVVFLSPPRHENGKGES